MNKPVRSKWVSVVLLLHIALPCSSRAAEPPSFLLASQEEGRSVLAVRDEFVERMSPFDRAARLKTATDISEHRYLEFVRSNVLSWDDEASTTRVSRALESVARRLGDLDIALPGNILIVRTTGLEEGGAAYTRGNAIVLPDTVLKDSELDLMKVISHETFHVLTRSSKTLRASAYKVIGFTSCPEFRFPPELADRKITNPDAPRNDHWIHVQFRGERTRAIPVLFASTPKYDLAKGGEFFEYLHFALALTPLNADAESRARIVDVGEVQGFFEQVGRNTDYIIHPEEILADNFALLFAEVRALPSPAIVTELLSVVRATLSAEAP